MTTGDRIRKAREVAGLSRRQLAERSGVSESAISQYERKLRQPQALQLAKIAYFLNVSTDFLLGETNNNIAQLRREKGLSQEELATAAGVTLEKLGDFEAGKKAILSMRDVGSISKILGAGIQDVLSDAQIQEIRSLAAAFDPDKTRKMIKLGLATSEYLRALHELGVAPKAYDVDAFPIEGISQLANMVVVFCEGILAMANEVEIDITPRTKKDEPK